MSNNIVNNLQPASIPKRSSTAEIEKYVLCFLLQELGENNLNDTIILSLKDEDFSDYNFRIIFQEIKKVWRTGAFPDIMSVMKQIMEDKLPNDIRNILIDISGSYVSSVIIEQYVAILKGESLGRKLMNLCNVTIHRLMEDENVADTLDLLVKQLGALAMNTDKEKVVEVCEVVNNVTDRIDENRKEQQDNSLPGIPTGFPRYDFTTGGFHPGNLVVIGGDNSQGKTSLALSIALFALKMGRKSAIYSLEMTNEELVARMLSMELNVPGLTSNKILYNKLSDEDVKNIHLNKHKISDLPLYFDDRSKSSLDNIIRSATLNVPKYKLDFIVIDYLQILSFSKKGQTTEEVLSEATRRLKQLAIDLKICVILLSQINRDKNDPEPQKNRLKGSSGIEANADNIILVYRPEVYGKNLTYSQPEYKDVSPINTALIKVAKGRNIGIFDFIVGFDGEHTRFYALDEYSLPSIRNNNFNNTPQPQQEEEQKFVPFVDEETEYTAF